MTHKYTQNKVDSLLKIMQTLRAPDGCPWDAEQTPESLTSYILEEACELIDAIEHGDQKLILDELGDLLLQVVFLAQIFDERGQFDFHDVAAGIAEKLVRRHPHVFAPDGTDLHSSELEKQWEDIKRAESTHKKTCLADHLPSQLPALQRAQKLIDKACRAGLQPALPVESQQLLQNIQQAQVDKDPFSLDEQVLGQMLFCLVKLAHDANLDAEAALRKTTRETIEHLESD
jgi:tetrapyrrole methylase family protein/MazG family protein/ATP diphosphatase